MYLCDFQITDCPILNSVYLNIINVPQHTEKAEGVDNPGLPKGYIYLKTVRHLYGIKHPFIVGMAVIIRRDTEFTVHQMCFQFYEPVGINIKTEGETLVPELVFIPF